MRPELFAKLSASVGVAQDIGLGAQIPCSRRAHEPAAR